MSVCDHPSRQFSQNGAYKKTGTQDSKDGGSKRRCRSEENVTLIDSEMASPLAVVVQHADDNKESPASQMSLSSDNMPTTAL